MSLSTHVLDTVTGRPAAGVPVTLRRLDRSGWVEVASGRTNADGRLSDWVPAEHWRSGLFELRFNVLAYRGEDSLFPEIGITFRVSEPGRLHLPLLLSGFGYTTYRGS